MQPINTGAVQASLRAYVGKTVYLHLETTNGSYSEAVFGAFMRGIALTLVQADVRGTGPFRAGLQVAGGGWIYAEGLTDWEIDAAERLLLAGHDKEGRLTVALELSPTPLPT